MASMLPLVWAVAAGSVWVIPPGQEQVLLQMTSLDPPVAGCKLHETKVDAEVVRVSYECGTDYRVVTLYHRDQPAADAGTVLVRTSQFAIVPLDPAPPIEVLARLEEQVRANEARFNWVEAEVPPAGGAAPPPAVDGGNVPPGPGAPGAAPERVGPFASDTAGTVALIVGVLLLVGLAVFLVARRKK